MATMGVTDQILAVIGAAAGVAGAYFAYLAVDQRFRKARPSSAAPEIPADQEPYDVFVSYAVADSGWAEWLAERLRGYGLSVFLAAWIAPGLVMLLEQENALLRSAHGVLVFSKATMAEPAIAEEYAVLLSHARATGGRFIPVVIDDVALPPFAAIRQPVSFRDGAAAACEDQLAALMRAVSGRTAGLSRHRPP